MQRIGSVGLIRIALPGRDPVLLCDGGFIIWNGETYRSKDPTFGSIAAIDGLEEGQGDSIPALDLQLNPPGTAAIADLSQPGYQTAQVQMWLAEFSTATGQVTGTPDGMFDGQVDQTSLRLGRARTLSVSVVSNAERLFEFDIGNSWSATFHQSVHPGELGHNNAAGLKVPEAWGTEGGPVAGGGRGGRDGTNGGVRARSMMEF